MTSWQGNWKDDKQHGKGTLVSDNGTYQGMWKDGKKHGQGELKLTNGEVYTGEWAEDMRHGQGVHFYNDERKYEGQWVTDKVSSAICVVPSTGRRRCRLRLHVHNLNAWIFCMCPLSLLQRHGGGTLTLPDGGRYEGEWEDDVKHGKGTVFLSTGETVIGLWIQGGLHNPVDFTFAQSSRWNDPQI